MKNVKLTKEERDWESWIVSGKAKRIPNFEKARKALAASARAQIKTKLVSIRVRENDLARLRDRAADEGIPYQTVINSLIHKYAEGRV